MILDFFAIASFPIEFSSDIIEVILTENIEPKIRNGITYESKILMAKEVKTIQGDKKIRTHILPVIGRGDNLQLFISPLLKYEGWLYNIVDDKNFEINSLEPPCTGGLKIPHTPIGTSRNAKNEILNFVLIVVKMCSNELKRTTYVNLIGIV